jgi:hypothetical protein
LAIPSGWHKNETDETGVRGQGAGNSKNIANYRLGFLNLQEKKNWP